MGKTNRKTGETKSGNFRLLATALPALDALALMPVLGRIMSSSAGKAGDINFDKIKETELSSLAGALTELFIQLDQADVADLTYKLLAGSIILDLATETKHEITHSDAINDSNIPLPDLITFLGWSVKFNFADFLKGALLTKLLELGRSLQTQSA